MNKTKLVQTLSCKLDEKFQLSNSNDFVVLTIKSLIKKHPKLSTILNKKEEDFSLQDLQIVMSYIETDKRINKLKIQKKHKKIIRRLQGSNLEKQIIYDFLKVVFFIYISLLVLLLSKKKCKKYDPHYEHELAIDEFLNRKIQSNPKSKSDPSPKV